MAGTHVDPVLGKGAEDGHVEGSDSREVLIGYLTTLWESERENAERITRKIELVSGGIIALMGLGFFSIQWIYQYPAKSLLAWPKVSTWVLHVLLCGVVLCFSRALFALYVVKRRRTRTATEFLEITPSDRGRPTRMVLIGKLSHAYNYLKRRNNDARAKLRVGERWFAYGLALLLAVLLLYLVISANQKISPKGTDYDTNGRNAATSGS
jgi:uncharacterized membrane protein YecN with MAPEG domain